jgi:leucyl-tRNA synthetase
MAGEEVKKSFARRDALLKIEEEVQKKWAEQKIFEVDAPAKDCEKFFVTFPYPYTNGKFHIGHAFSVSKAIFAAHFQRLCGKKVLFPFGYHCTGMPIQAAANKLKREYEVYGSPFPTFPPGRPAPKTNEEGVPLMDDDGNAILTYKIPCCTGNKPIKEYHLFSSAKGSDFKRVLVIKPEELTVERGKVTISAPLESGGCAFKIVAQLADGSMTPESKVSDEVSVGEAPAKKGTGAPAGKRVAKKILMKTGDAAFQFEILMQMGVEAKDMEPFKEPEYWVHYFPPTYGVDLARFGMPSDFRRSFVTTSINPYYDKFIRWQFNKLKKGEKIGFGKRPTIYSNVDGQACMDHDRAEGEGVAPQEYTAIKLELLEKPAALKKIEKKKIFLLAATLRPETMPGQTNCWILPKGEYGCFDAGGDVVYVCSKRAAFNMSFQDILKPWGKPKCLLEITGQDIMGCKVKAPQGQHPIVHLLPLMTIKMDKGTGIVTSVPSDSPDDYAAYSDLKKPGKRDFMGIKAEWIEPFDLIPILKVEIDGEMREFAAQYMCEKLGVQSQNDKEKLLEAHDVCYKLGFDKGIMTTGPMKDRPVKLAKFEFRTLMIDAGEAFLYHEPEKKVVGRSGDECVVAGIDQWYLKYGDPSWRKLVEEHLDSENFNCYASQTKDAFQNAISWLKEWACSRSFGLGTKVPWDEKFLIESLSDSTIYMAYYTVAHFLQQGSLDGSKGSPYGINPDDLTDDVWDFIFLNGPAPKKSKIKKDVLEKMKREFRFWYPLDLRVSARDLIQNHLTMSLYNHAAVWEDEPHMWPRSMWCNGMLLMNNEKMSKSKGNFYTLEEMMEKFGADATRLSCADAGDTLEDGNFQESIANKGINNMHVFLETMTAMVSGSEPLDTKGKPDGRFVDRWFVNEMNRLVEESREHYTNMFYKDALRTAYFEFMAMFDQYRDTCKQFGQPLKSLVLKYYEWQLIILAPICPHFCEHGWAVLGKKGSILDASFPKPSAPVDDSIVQQGVHVFDKLPHHFIKLLEKCSKNGRPTDATVYIADSFPEWKVSVLEKLRASHAKGVFPMVTADNMKDNDVAKGQWKDIVTELMSDPALKPFGKHVGPFAAFKRDEAAVSGISALDGKLGFDEMSLLRENAKYIGHKLGMPVTVKSVAEAPAAQQDKAKEAQPGAPAVVFAGVDTGSAKGAAAGKQSGASGAKAAAPAANGVGGAPAKFTGKLIKDLKALDSHLSERSYFEGGAAATEADFAQLAATPSAGSSDEFPHVKRWHNHMTFLNQKRRR